MYASMFSEIGTDFAECNDVSNIKSQTSKQTYPELRHSLGVDACVCLLEMLVDDVITRGWIQTHQHAQVHG